MVELMGVAVLRADQDALDLHLSDGERRALRADERAGATQLAKPIADAGEPGRVNRPLVSALADTRSAARRLFARRRPGDRAVPDPRGAGPRSCTEAETAFALQGLGAYPIAAGGPRADHGRVDPAGRRRNRVAAFALTEPEAGSDVSALSLEAEPDGRRLPADRREAVDLKRARGRHLHGLRACRRGRAAA